MSGLAFTYCFSVSGPRPVLSNKQSKYKKPLPKEQEDTRTACVVRPQVVAGEKANLEVYNFLY